jgi:indolepyruvate ferredoxin oxidoreductase
MRKASRASPWCRKIRRAGAALRELAPGVTVHDRAELDAVQRELRDVPGVTRHRVRTDLRGREAPPPQAQAAARSRRRVFINPRVCEGCGDCSVQSNCISIEPLETPSAASARSIRAPATRTFRASRAFARASSRSKARACASRTTRACGAGNRAGGRPAGARLCRQSSGSFNVLVTGIGGTGVLTMGALLGGAAHLDGKGATVLDFTGLAQKNGAVVSQVRIAASPEQIGAVRIGPGAPTCCWAPTSWSPPPPTTWRGCRRRARPRS